MTKSKKQKRNKELKRVPLSDELYAAILQVHMPLTNYVVTHYREEVYNQNRASVIVFGELSLPLAIEFTQWRYDTIFIGKTRQDIDETPETCKKFGVELKKVIWSDYLINVPRATIIVCLDALNDMPSEDAVIRWIDLLLRRCHEVVFSVKESVKWESLLSEHYTYSREEYPKGGRIIVSLKASVSLDQLPGDEQPSEQQVPVAA